MNIETFYNMIGGDYNGIMGRFVTEERVLRFVRKFPADGSFALLKDSLASGNASEAFRAAHTLKGVAQNLGFDALYKIAAEVTDVLRGGNLDVGAFMPDLEAAYNLVTDGIAALD